MKTIRITLLFVAVLLLTINGYSQTTNVKALLDKPETRTEVFNTILGDHQLMMEFMTAMKGNEHAMMMMNGNNPMMAKDGRVEMAPEQGDMQHEHQMMGHGDMMDMMKDNPEMMQKMMGNMMDMCEQDSTMSHEMANMMTDHPEMMQMCMKKMNEKGMMGTDGKMKMMKSKDQKENSEHHRHQ